MLCFLHELFLCIISYLCHWSVPGTYGAETFLVSGTSGQWPAAEASCRTARGRLALVDTRDRMAAFNGAAAGIAPGVPVWVDRYVGYTDVVSIEGRWEMYLRINTSCSNSCYICLIFMRYVKVNGRIK